ncbi:PAS domain S-box protein [Aquiflexum lacus]|uniref:PAS domain S-box protein n=1 Tax=Aquiflexum lacus TaxID=2483805 RepID=UPI001893B106|nr:PAS domain S-box protein [Aquiflexum lacus]
MTHINLTNKILDQTKDLVWAVDNNLYLVYANSAYLNLMKEVTGVEKKLNTPILVEGFGEGYIEKWKAYYKRALSGEFFEIEEHFYNPDTKEMQYGHVAFSPIMDEDGEILTVSCRSADISPIIRQKDHASRLMDATLDVFCTIDQAGNFVFVSNASIEHWGFRPEELIGTPYRDLILEEDLEKTDLVASEIMAGKDIKSFSNRYRKKNGDIAYNLWSVHWGNEPKHMYCVARDAKEKIEEEERLKLLEKVINSTTDPILVTEAEPQDDPGPRIVYVNKAFTKMTGYTAKEVIGKTPRILQGPDSDYDALKKLGEKMRRWEPSEITVLNYSKSGKPFWVNFAVSPVADEKGWFTHWISVQRDVTEQKKLEAEKELLSQISLSFNNEKELIPATNRLCDNLYDFGKFDLIELWCPNMEQTQIKLIGHSTHNQNFYELEPLGTSFQKNEGLPGKVWGKGNLLFWDEKQIKKHFVRKKGASRVGLKAVLGIPLTFSDELVGVLLVGTNREPEYLEQHSPVMCRLETFIGSEINRKRLENDLVNVYDAIPEILCITDLEGRFLKINNAGCKLLGFKSEEVLFHSLEKFTLKEDKGKFKKEINKVNQDSSIFTFENRFLSKDGKVIWLSWNCNTALEEGLIYASAKNITSEVQLRELNAQASSLAKIGSWEINLEEKTVYWSKVVHHLHETDPITYTPDLETAIDFYREDFRTLVQSSIAKSSTTGEGFDFEAVIVTKKLKERWVRAIGNVEFANGVATRIYGSFQDISDRKEPELRLQSFADNLPGVAFQYYLFSDGTDALKYVTDGSKKVWGFDADSVMRENNLVWKQIEIGGELDLVKKSIMNSLETKSDWKAQWRYITPTNELRTHAGYGSPNFLPDGTVVFNSLILDITEEYRSEELLKQASEMAKIGSWELNLIDQKNDSMYWSPMTLEILEVDDNYDPSLTGGFEFYEAESKSLIKKGVEELIESGTPFDLELMIQTEKRSSKWIRCIGNAEFIDRTCARIYGSFQDIHDRKTAEIQLKTLTNNLPGVVFQYLVFPDGKDALRSVSKGSYQIWGYSPEEVEHDINLVWNQTKSGGGYQQVKKDVIEAVRTKSKWFSRYKSVQPSGEVQVHLGSGTPSFLADGTVLFNSFVMDVTKEAKYEELLSEAIQMARIGSWEVNFHNNKIIWSEITHQLHETDPTSFIPDLEKSINFYREDFRDMVQSRVEACIEEGKPFDFQAVIVTAKNNEKWVRAIGRAEIINGQCKRIHGSFQDIHEAKSNELRLKEILESISDAFYAIDSDWNFTYFNREAENLLKKSADEVLGGNIWEIFSPAKGTVLEEIYMRVAVTGQSENFEYHYPGDGCWYEITTYPSGGGISSYFKNIDERRMAAQDLERAYQERSSILESISDNFYALNSKFEFTYMNSSCAELLQVEASDIINENLFDRFPDLKNTLFESQLLETQKTGMPVKFEFFYESYQCWFIESIYPNNDGFSVYFYDITKIKEAEKQILEKNKQLTRSYEEKNNILESIGDAFFAVNEDWTITYWNKQSEIIMGRNKESILGKNLWELYPDAIDTDFYVQYHRAKETGETVNFEEYYPTLDIWVEVTVYPSENGLSIYFKDITLRKAADILLLEANERFELVTKATNDAIWDWDIENDHFFRSDSIHKIFGKGASTELNKNQFWQDAFHPEDLGKLKESIQSAINDSQSERWEMEYRVLSENNEELSVIDRGIIVRNKSGKAIRMVGAMTDLTKQKRLEKELFELNESLKNYAKELERSNEELEQFAFITSHDLQEPLRMISGFMDLLKRKYTDQLDEKGMQYIQYATDGAKRMKQIILDLLLYSRANRPTEQFEEVDLNEIVSEYCQLRRKLIAEKIAAIKFDGLPVLQTYRAPITQVVHCLLDNALKYAKENVAPHIEIRAQEKEAFWEFAVKDNGIGIDEMFYNKVFIIFQRLHNRNQHDGTGIGLSIAKRSVEFLGGEIWLESKVGEGTTFYFTIRK